MPLASSSYKRHRSCTAQTLEDASCKGEIEARRMSRRKEWREGLSTWFARCPFDVKTRRQLRLGDLEGNAMSSLGAPGGTSDGMLWVSPRVPGSCGWPLSMNNLNPSHSISYQLAHSKPRRQCGPPAQHPEVIGLNIGGC